MDQEKRSKNPYRWHGRDPARFISRRTLLGEALSLCGPGPNESGALLLLGTRGMGKSMFLARLREELIREPENDVILIEGPPLARGQHLGGDEMLEALSNRLIIEVKHWDNKDVGTIHDQVLSYAAKGVVAFATVVISDHKDHKGPGWSAAFEAKCLKDKIDGAAIWKELDAPLFGYFEARKGAYLVEHFLLRLASRGGSIT